MIQRWYDIYCDKCGKYASSDFNIGMQLSKRDIIQLAKEKGW